MVASLAMGYLSPWPGTFNRILDAHYQHHRDIVDWPDKKVLFFDPANRNDTQPWANDANSPAYMYPWLINENADFPNVNIWRWQSNFWFCCTPLTEKYYSYYNIEGGLEEFYEPYYDKNYAVYQGPYKWRTLTNDPGTDWGHEISPLQLENSMWDWAEDGSCAESDFKTAYVRRKSDGSIWRFRNWKPTGNVYTDFPNLAMRPVEPVQGVEYANFFMNGPPIPGNETWNTLMVLK